jgi:hypothetical protein
MKLTIKNGNHYFINSKRTFVNNSIDEVIINKCYEFAVKMVFGEGHHRKYRSGGQYSRKNGELFANTLQGKISEFVTYHKLINAGFVDLELPDINIYGKGKWDDTDLEFNYKKINIKSSTHFSNLLLLEKKDWNLKGQYIPNIENDSSQDYDYFLVVRIKPDIKYLLQKEKLFYKDDIDLKVLKELVFSAKWYYDFGGVCTQKTIRYIITNNYFLPQKALLNGKMEMDADNYYLQNGNLKDFDYLINELKKL